MNKPVATGAAILEISKEVFGWLSLVICIMQYTPLIYLTLIGKKKPHALARLIWALTFGIGYAAQYFGHGGAGAWANGFSALLSIVAALVALRNSKAYITRSDLFVFVSALLAIPLWLATNNPLYAALWVTAIDSVGYVPIFRKAWHKPYEEMVYVSVLSCIKDALSLLAMETYSLTTVVMPIAAFVADFVFIFFALWRRQILIARSRSFEGKQDQLP